MRQMCALWSHAKFNQLVLIVCAYCGANDPDSTPPGHTINQPRARRRESINFHLRTKLRKSKKARGGGVRYSTCRFMRNCLDLLVFTYYKLTDWWLAYDALWMQIYAWINFIIFSPRGNHEYTRTSFTPFTWWNAIDALLWCGNERNLA